MKWFIVALVVIIALIGIFAWPLLFYALYFLVGPLIPFLVYAAIAIVVRLGTRRLNVFLSWGLAGLAVVAFAVLIPLYANRPTDEVIAQSRAGDRNLENPLPPIKTLAYLGHGHGRDGPSCNEICQRLLYDGTVDAVIVRGSFIRPKGPRQKTVAYRIEQRDACPTAALSAQTTTERTQEAVQAAKETATRVTARIAVGECLIEEPAKLDDADAVLINQRLRLSHAYTLVDSIDRVSLFVRTPEGLAERFRRTAVRYKKVDTPLMFGFFGRPHGTFASLFGISTTREQIGTYDMFKVLADDLGLNVAVPESTVSLRDTLKKALADERRQPGDPGLKLAGALIEDIAEGSAHPGDVALIAAIVADPRVKLHFELPRAVSKLGPQSAELAGPLLDRILAAQVDDDSRDIYAASQAAYVLPAGAHAGYRDKLVAIAEDGKRGDMAYLAIARLADSGPQNVPLLRARLRGAGDKRGALMALCRLGEEAQEAKPEVAAILEHPPPTARRIAERTMIRITGPNDPAPEPTPSQRRGQIDPRPERARTDAVVIACRP